MAAIAVWLSAIASNPVIMAALPQAVRDILSKFFGNQAARAEAAAVVKLAKAGSLIADNASRAEALREASKRLSDISYRG